MARVAVGKTMETEKFCVSAHMSIQTHRHKHTHTYTLRGCAISFLEALNKIYLSKTSS